MTTEELEKKLWDVYSLGQENQSMYLAAVADDYRYISPGAIDEGHNKAIALIKEIVQEFD